MEKWEFEKSDFWNSHPEFEISRPYKLWFEYLKVSPTMALAHKIHSTKKGLTEEEKLLLPDDFEQVIKVYHDLELKLVLQHRLCFRTWWHQVAEGLFGVRLTKPMVSKIFGIKADEAINNEYFLNALNQYLEGNLKIQHKRGFWHMVLTIPMTGDKGDLLRQISELINFDEYLPPKSMIYGRYLLEGQRIHLEPLKTGLKLIWLKAENPYIQKWRLGLKADVSPKYSYLDPYAEKLPPEYKEAKRIVGITTDRALNKAIRIMENAARGRFPCQDPVPMPEINWQQFNQRLQKMMRDAKQRERMALIEARKMRHFINSNPKLTHLSPK